MYMCEVMRIALFGSFEFFDNLFNSIQLLSFALSCTHLKILQKLKQKNFFFIKLKLIIQLKIEKA